MADFVRTLTLLTAGCLLWLGASSKADGLLLEERSWRAEVDGLKATVTVVERWVVANRQAERQLGELVFSENRFRRLKDVTVTVRDTTGRVLDERSKKKIEKHCGFGAGYQAYSDICYYTHSTIGQPFPYVIETIETSELESLFFLRGTQLIPDRHPFVVSRAELRLKHPSSVSYRLRGGLAEPEITRDGDWTIYSWVAEGPDSMEADTTDDGGFLAMVVQPLEFGGYELEQVTWSEVGHWYAELAREQYNLSDEKPIEIREEAAVRREVDAAADSVRKQCRYVSISLGVGGWRPTAARSTLARGYGDCKDLSTALIDLLRLRGVSALPVLILTRGEGVIDSTFPEFGFNHVITAVLLDDDTLWVDPTCRTCSPGDLPLMDENLLALLVAADGGHLVRTPASRPGDNRRVLSAQVTIHADFTISAVGTCDFYGNEAHRLKYLFAGETETSRRELLARLLEGSGSKLAIESFTVSGEDDATGPLQITFEVTSQKPLRTIGGKTYLTGDILAVGTEPACLLGYPNVAVDSIVVDVSNVPAVDSIILPHATDTTIFGDSVQITTAAGDSLIILVRREAYVGYWSDRKAAWNSSDPPKDLRRHTNYVVVLTTE